MLPRSRSYSPSLLGYMLPFPGVLVMEQRLSFSSHPGEQLKVVFSSHLRQAWPYGRKSFETSHAWVWFCHCFSVIKLTGVPWSLLAKWIGSQLPNTFGKTHVRHGAHGSDVRSHGSLVSNTYSHFLLLTMALSTRQTYLGSFLRATSVTGSRRKFRLLSKMERLMLRMSSSNCS